MQGGAGCHQVVIGFTFFLNRVLHDNIMFLQGCGKDGGIPRVDQQASTSPQQTVPATTTGRLMIARMGGLIKRFLIQETAKDRERLREVEAECMLLKERLNRCEKYFTGLQN